MVYFNCCREKEGAIDSLPQPPTSQKLGRLDCAIRVLVLATIATFISVMVMLGLAQADILPPTGAFYTFVGFVGLLLITRLLDTCHDAATKKSSQNP